MVRGMATALLLLGGGALILYAGAEVALRGATAAARAAGVPAFVIGALLFGVDVEGLGAALSAAGRGATRLATGEIFGTVLFLFAAAFGVALVLARRPVPAPSGPMMAAPAPGVALCALVIADRFVNRMEGGLLLLAYALYVVFVLWERRPDPPEDVPERPDLRRSLVLAGVGIGVVYLGAWLLVGGGSRLVTLAALSGGFVGAAIVGALASLDEVVLEVLPVRRGVPELATGNLYGTLAAFTTGVLGLAALVRPLALDTAGNITFLAVAVLYAGITTVFFVRGRVGWVVGTVVLGAYAGWLVYASGL